MCASLGANQINRNSVETNVMCVIEPEAVNGPSPSNQGGPRMLDT